MRSSVDDNDDDDKGEGPSRPRSPAPSSLRSGKASSDSIRFPLEDDVFSRSPSKKTPAPAATPSMRRFPARVPDRQLNGSPLPARTARRGRDASQPDAASMQDSIAIVMTDLGAQGRQDQGFSSGRQQQRAAPAQESDARSLYPPSFAESQFATIIRRQRKRRVFSPLENALEGQARARDQSEGPPASPARAAHDNNGKQKRIGEELSSEADSPFTLEHHPQLKLGRSASHTGAVPTEAEALDAHLGSRAWEFSGWGSSALLELRPRDWRRAKADIAARPPRDLGQLSAAAIAGNAVTGSVLYTLPAVLAVAGVYAPISIFVACLLIGPFRPLLVELSSALGASDSVNYGYFSNISTRTMALVAAGITALDALATGAVSASTAAAYVDADTGERVGSIGWTIILFFALVLVALFGIRDSTRVAVAMISIHMATMAILIIASCVHWGQIGSDIVRDNWRRASALTGDKTVARALFDGVCLGFVGLTGFECSLSYVTRVKEGEFAKALRWLQVIVLVTEAPLMLLCLAAIPMDTLSSSATSSGNILATLAQQVGKGSQWLKILVIIDAVIVLSGGIITGIFSFNGLTEALGRDFVVPDLVLKTLPKTGARAVSIALYFVLGVIMLATARFNSTMLASIFSLTFLSVMSLFCIALLMLKHNRPTIQRSPQNSLPHVLLSLSIAFVAIVGNVVLGPGALLSYAVYLFVVLAALWAANSKVAVARLLYWTLEQNRTWLAQKIRATAGRSIVKWIQSKRKHPVVYFTKTDELSMLIEVLIYVRNNEHTARVILVHCYDQIESIPSELEANYQLVDESFPMITVDLVFVEAPFNALTVQALSTRLDVPLSRCFISCPSTKGNESLSDYGGIRIITD